MMIPRPTTVEEVEFTKKELIRLFRAARDGIRRLAHNMGLRKGGKAKTGLEKPHNPR